MQYSEYSIWDILQFGDFIPLDVLIDNSIKQDLQKYKDKWSIYNPRRNIKREGLCVLNERGEVGPGPALDSLKQYNKENNTNWNETDFNKPTDLYHSSKALQSLLGDILHNCVRTHFIKLAPGGFFPPHRDHTRGKQNTFRLILPIQNVNPPYCNFNLENKPLYFEYNKMYFINTTKQHTLFNASATRDSIWLIINAILCKDMVDYVINNLAEQ
tara:strand:- start:1305 stop:1946 length:642 start_codon:yes stop_codon:yes gene_type:complete